MRAVAAGLALMLVTASAVAEPLAREDVPEPLRPWVDWALRGQEEQSCPFLNESGHRPCVWPGRLALVLDARGGEFEQDVFVAIESEVALPGALDGAWPEDVRAGGEPVAVTGREEGPVVRLPRGNHRISGRFAWSSLPSSLRVPLATGLVELTLAGERVARPRRDPDGSLWLRDGSANGTVASTAANRVEVEVHRRLADGVPIALDSVVTLRVSGEAREELLGVALPEGFAPTLLASPLPARLEPDGRLRVQVRPGEWFLRIGARLAERGDVFRPPRQPSGALWDASEIWSVARAPQLRLVDVEGAPTVDPTQTEMPAEWRELPAYRFERGSALKLVEKRRGNQGSAADQLALERTWHLDFDARGATVVDRVEGTLRSALRLEMGEATTLGRAAIGGQDQPITRRAGSERLGVETALGALALEADSRVEGGARKLPAVGWAHDFDRVAATLMIPPGYRLLHVTGVDRADATWISRWDLLDIFFVLLVCVAAGRLFGRNTALLAGVTLVLLWPESSAPRLVWLALVVAEALRRVATRGRLARAVQTAHLATLVLLVVLAVPFAIRQLRVGLFPALERPYASVWPRVAAPLPMQPAAVEEAAIASDAAAGNAEGVVAAEMPAEMRAMKRARPSAAPVPMSVSTLEKGTYELAYGRANFAPDPNASVPTGPGRPDWSWESVALSWSGPVTADQQLGLWLVPPWANALLAIARVLLLAALARTFFAAWQRARGGDSGAAASTQSLAPRGAAALVALALVTSFAGAARADLPTPELLEALRERMLEPPACHPSCATLTRLALGVSPERLDLRLALDASAETGIPLPGGGASDGAWRPSAVILDGSAASGLYHDAQGVLWLHVAPGRHELQLAGPLPQRATVELPLPLAPQRIALAAKPVGWSVVGIRPDGRANGALQLVRAARAAATDAAGARFEPTPIPSFVRVERQLELGLSWVAHTRVVRVAPDEGPIVVEVPLLAGESVTTPGVRVERGRALVTIPAGEGQAGYSATLAIAERIALTAPKQLPWTEIWQVDAGPLWHVEAEGLPPVDEPGEGVRSRRWAPWPGEKLTLAIERPAGIDAATLTLDRSQLALMPGRRATDATLTLALRSSQGGQHAATLPEGAQLTSLLVNGAPQPLQQEGRRVPLTLAPGAREVVLGWREPRGISPLFRASEVDVGAASVNAHVEVAVPEQRWVLLVGGPRLGPSVMFWPALVVVAGLAWLLGRFGGTPLRARHWLLLGVGLTQASFVASVPVLACLLALGWRGRAAERVRMWPPIAFRALQLALVLLTIAAAGALVVAIQQGLLGTPEMRIAGNGSSGYALRWYLDRSAALLPQPFVLSLSIWWYRAAMLAWSMWLALALVGWARWAFAQWSAGGMFRAEPAAEAHS